MMSNKVKVVENAAGDRVVVINRKTGAVVFEANNEFAARKAAATINQNVK